MADEQKDPPEEPTAGTEADAPEVEDKSETEPEYRELQPGGLEAGLHLHVSWVTRGGEGCWNWRVLLTVLVPGWATVIARSIESDYPGRYGGGFIWLMSYLLVLAAPVVFLLAPALKIEDEEVQWGFGSALNGCGGRNVHQGRIGGPVPAPPASGLAALSPPGGSFPSVQHGLHPSGRARTGSTCGAGHIASAWATVSCVTALTR